MFACIRNQPREFLEIMRRVWVQAVSKSAWRWGASAGSRKRDAVFVQPTSQM